MSRRSTLALAALGAGAAALGAVAARVARPRDRGAPHPPYFSALQDQLAACGPGKPVLLVDLDALDDNLDTVRRTVPDGLAVRVVAKSLPSLPLLAHVLAALGSDRLMVFDDSMSAMAAAFPECDLLSGKPLPARLVERFVETTPAADAGRAQWLVDDLDRLDAYAAVAARHGVRLRINLEIDVGLHRGGFATPEALGVALQRIAARPAELTFSGLMGYDPHVAAAPAILAPRAKAFAEATRSYEAFVARVRAHDPAWLDGATLNGAGSKTYPLHQSGGPVNEVALGTGFVLPTDFDVTSTSRARAAVFIATPVLKALEGTCIPFLERASSFWPAWDRNRERTYFLFGGGWLAKPISPPGLCENPLYGFSTNQALLNGSGRTGLRAEDWVFFRPTQSERVLQELGAMHLVRAGRLEGTWPVLPFA